MKQISFIFLLFFATIALAQTPKPPFVVKDSAKVSVLEGGIKLYVIKEGTGKMPKATDEVTVNYHGRLANGKVFDSSFDRKEAISFPLNQVIKGWTVGFQTMKEGALFVMVIPPAMAYGSQELPGLPANSTLIFDCEFIKIGNLSDGAVPPPVKDKVAEQMLPSPLKKQVKTKQLVGKWLITDMKFENVNPDDAEMVDMMKGALVGEKMTFEFTADGTNKTSSKSMPDTKDMKYTLKNNIITILDPETGKSDTSTIIFINKKSLHINMNVEGKIMTLMLTKQKK